MIIVDDCIISDNLADVCFSCDLAKCKGACCVEGDCGAPLDAEEIPVLQRIYPDVKAYMSVEGIAAVEQQGVSSLDVDKQPCTPLVDNRDCAYAVHEHGLTLCAIEKAWRDGKVDFQKPISCHLYPVRIEDYGEFKAVNYHEWDICRYALAKGREEGRPLYQYLKEPLVRRFGQAWYDELVEQCEQLKS
ncbi:MAG: DUF3109 family protein [Bacteroidales bacterium]|jgi:hypothetical protein|nr:DUF3109 family protein [Bacteroidales bacterium]